MAIILIIFKFFLACFIGGIAALVVIEWYERSRPWYQELQSESHRNEMRKATSKTCNFAGLIVGVGWLIYHFLNTN